MCKDFSGIITEKGEVLWLKEDTTDHETIIAKHGLKDADDAKIWVRFEINYKDLAKISRNRAYAVFKWDCQTLPKWAEENAVVLIANAWSAWEESRKTAVILESETVAEVKDYFVAVCLGKIEYVHGNAKIENVSDNAKIESVSDNAKIEYVSDNAKIENVYDNAQIEYVSDNAKIKTITEFASALKDGVIYLAKKAKTRKIGKVP